MATSFEIVDGGGNALIAPLTGDLAAVSVPVASGNNLTPGAVPSVIRLSIPNAASGDDDFPAMPFKALILKVGVIVMASGNAGNTYTLKNVTSSQTITDDITPGATLGNVKEAANLETGAAGVNVVSKGDKLRISHVRAGGSSLAEVQVWVVPVP